MKISIIAFSNQGTELAAKVGANLAGQGHHVEGGYKGKFEPPVAEAGQGFTLSKIRESLGQWTEKSFQSSDCILFIGACGIAVRAIGPFIKSKDKDPAVIVMDEKGDFVISLLSGHIGGANHLTSQLADMVGATAVITTATDRNNKFAVDQWATVKGLKIINLKAAKDISAGILDGRPVGFKSQVEMRGKIPDEISFSDCKEGIYISDGSLPVEQCFTTQLNLVAPTLTLGIGCRRGTSKEAIETLVYKVLKEESLSIDGVGRICSIDLKKDEEGLLDFCGEVDIEPVFFKAEELLSVEGQFTQSTFVKSITGVDNVCERSCLAGAEKPARIIVKKTALNGVTVAVAKSDVIIDF